MQEKYIKATLSKITSLNLKTQFKGQRYWVFGVIDEYRFMGRSLQQARYWKSP